VWVREVCSGPGLQAPRARRGAVLDVVMECGLVGVVACVMGVGLCVGERCDLL